MKGTTISNRYRIIETLKERKNYTTYRAADLKKKREVALKVLDLKKSSESEVKKIKNELNIIKKIESKYSLKCYDSFETLSEMYIVYEYCQDNLLDKLKELNRKDSKIYYIKKIFNQLMEVYKVLHDNQIIIRELKPENILIQYTNEDETEFDIKISDYSFSKELSDNDLTKTIIGYSVYVAPEISRGFEYTNKCDLWSIGILGYVLYFGKVPVFKGINSFEIEVAIPEDNNFEDLIKKLLVSFPEKRISWDEFFNHSFFKQKTFGDVTKEDFEEVKKKYPKKENLQGIEVEEFYDKENNIYGEVIKGTKILYGRGIFIAKTLNTIVKGYFFNGMLHGKGEIIYNNGDYCEGEFLNGEQFGEGKEVAINGNEYTGHYKNNLYDGKGKLKYNNGNIYDGEFKNGLRYGYGKLFNKKQGHTTECNWLNGLKNGPGKIIFTNGKRIEGNWKNGVRDGEFKYYKSGEQKETKVEIYQNGVMVSKNQ